MGLTMPTVSVQLALTGTVWAGDNWVEISPFVHQFSVTRGRQHELQRAEAGTLELTLVNTDGRFSPWSENSPYYNQLPATDSNPTAGTGTWTASGGTVARSTAEARYGTWSWALTATTAGTVTMTTDSATAATAGRTYQALAFTRAKTATRSTKVAIVWKKSTGAVISTVVGSAVTDTKTGWTTLLANGKAPATTASKEVKVEVATAAATDVTYVACAGIFDYTAVQGIAAVDQGWCVGQQVPLWAAQPVKITATWTGTTYPVFAGAISTWAPKYGTIYGEQKVKAYDLMHILALMPASGSTYVGNVLTDIPALYWRLGTPLGTTSVYDSSGNGHTGTASGVTFGESGGLAKTPGTAVLVSGGDVTGTCAGTSSMSVELLFWAKPGATSIPTLLEWGTSTTGPTIYHGVKVSASVSTDAPVLEVSSDTTTKVTASALSTTTWHHIVVTHGTGVLKLYVDGAFMWSVTVTDETPRTAVRLGTGAGTTWYAQEVALYRSALSATRVKAHYDAFKTGIAAQDSGLMMKAMAISSGVPKSAFSTFDTGTIKCKAPNVTVGLTQLLSTIQQTEKTELGFLYADESGKIIYRDRNYIREKTAAITSNGTFADDSTAAHYPLAKPPVPADDDLTLWNYIPVSSQGSTTPTVVQTPTSQAKYGTRMLSGYTGLYLDTPGTARYVGTLLLALFKKPIARVRSITLDSTAGTGKNLPQMLGRKLLDLVTVRWKPIDGATATFTQASNIEQVKHTVTKEKWVTEWALVPTLTTTWLVLTSADKGKLGTGRLG